jgi:DNA invertase Pin-like site-specific DNA recombinase
METAIRSPRKVAAVGYVRVSTGAQVREGGSLDEQRDALAFHAATSGLELVDVFEDAGLSGAKDETKRPGLAAALEAIRSGEARVLLVRDLSRLARDFDLIGYLRVAVRKLGGTVKVLGESEDRVYRLFDMVKSEMYRTAVSDRMKLWASSRQAKGLPMGRAPYGYQLGEDGNLVAVPSETPVIDRIKTRKAQGASLRTIAAELNAEEVPTRSGRPWNAQTVNAIVGRAE